MAKKRNKKMKSTTVAVIGALIIMLGGFLITYNYVQSKKVYAYDYVNTEFFLNNNQEDEVKEEKKKEEVEKKPEVVQEYDSYYVTDEYIGYLSIPKIKLNKGFVDRRSKENSVEKNIYIVDGSNYPDVDKGNFIIAGHSGTGWKAFFNDLYKLRKGDVAYITYKGYKYTYRITNIYKQQKVGKIAIYRNYEKTTLTLITCTNYDSKTQSIYVAELINKELE
ncbi:MAG: sortase [Bacilli bacterium]|nr:sortase [Bacilli bacterium]